MYIYIDIYHKMKKTSKNKNKKNRNKDDKGEKKFDPKEYERPGLTEEEIMEIKEAFDLFDEDG